jgi:hypothetical protein
MNYLTHIITAAIFILRTIQAALKRKNPAITDRVALQTINTLNIILRFLSFIRRCLILFDFFNF